MTSRAERELDERRVLARRAYLGLELEPGAIARMWSSSITAPEPLEGGALRVDADNRLTRPLRSLPWFAVAGVTFVLLSLGLQLVHRARNPARRTSAELEVPLGVRNAR